MKLFTLCNIFFCNIFWLLFCANAYAAPVKILSENNVQPVGELRYKIGQRDPYWIFDDISLDSETRILQIPITLSAAGPKNGSSTNKNLANSLDIEFEVFYKAHSNSPVRNGEKIRFSPFHKLKYSLSAQTLAELSPAIKITLALPNEIDLDTNAKLRLDINNCTGCEMKFSENGVNANTTPLELSNDSKNLQLTPALIMNGAQTMDTPTLALDHSNWRLHDLERIGDRLNINGNDPYLLSQQFAINTSTLGGVLIELSLNELPAELETLNRSIASAPSIPLAHFQIFYRTERHPFTEEASTIVGLPILKGGIEQTFFIPLDFVSTQDPVAEFLTGLRLDVDHINRLNKISLVDKKTALRYRQLIPNKIYQRKIQRAGLPLILAKIFNKFKKDLSFIILYTILIILVAIGFRRAYTRTF